MMRAIFLIDHDYEGTSGSYQDKIGMRHQIALSAGHLDLIRLKWHRVIELTDRVEDHTGPIYIHDRELVQEKSLM
jgi:hypothetical protein